MPHIERFDLRASAACERCGDIQRLLARARPETKQGQPWADFGARLADARALARQLWEQPAGRCGAPADAAATAAEIQRLMAEADAAADYNLYLVTNIEIIKKLDECLSLLRRALKCTSPPAQRRTPSPAVAPRLTAIPEGGSPPAE